jgi:putative FmdB family regulatory protein
MDTAVAKKVSLSGEVSAGEYIRGVRQGQGIRLAQGKRSEEPEIPLVHACERVRLLLYFWLELPREGGFLYGGETQLPIYEYQCSKGHEYERAESFTAPTKHRCPTCGSTSRRRISLPAVVFKGSGFYSTDNRKSSFGGNGSSSSTAESKASGESTSAGESKAEAKTAD